jgi:hypothetical protein
VNKPKEPIRACDVLNWDYLGEIEEKPVGVAQNLQQAIRGFAYTFRSTADENNRDQMLRDLLKNATDNHSKESAEDVIKALAMHLKCDRKELRRFAKENGVRLQTDFWLARRDPTFSDP